MFPNKLFNIFLYFPVCTHWRAISMNSWSRFKKLEFYLDTKQDRIDSICIQDIRIFYQVIGRVRNYLTSIKLHARTFDIGTKYEINHLQVLQILKNCPNIEELVILSGMQIHTYQYAERNCIKKEHKLLYYLEPHCKNLIKLGLDLDLFCDTSTEMAMLFQKMNKLESIHLVNTCSKIFDRDCLLSFPSASLKEFMLSRILIEDHSVEMFNSMISKCVDLQAVSIVIFNINWESALEALFLHKNIKYLQMGYYRFYKTSRSRRILDSYFSQLIHLEKLDLSFSCSIDDKLLQIVAANCQKITILNITFCNDMTDDGIVSVSSLKKLRYLTMDYVGYRVLCPKWNKMDCLETLLCMGSSLRCQSLCDLVLNKAPKLKLLDVTYCEQVDNRLIDAALEAVKSRDKNLGLTLGIFATKIRPNQEHQESDRLNIIKEGMIVTRQPIVGRRCYPVANE